eukprot:COSAG01_NODE_47320_length_391_cov_1.284247_1_plen_41_part_01
MSESFSSEARICVAFVSYSIFKPSSTLSRDAIVYSILTSNS